MPRRSAPLNCLARPRPATPAPIVRSPAASSCIRRQPREGREGRHHPYRRRPGSSDQSRHAMPERRGAARLRPCGDAHEISADPQARLRQVRAGLLGLRARPHRAADEGRSRQELHRQEQRRRDGQSLDHDRLPGRLGNDATKRRSRPTRSCAAPGWSYSTTKRGSDTARRWPVWPQRSAAVR